MQDIRVVQGIQLIIVFLEETLGLSVLAVCGIVCRVRVRAPPVNGSSAELRKNQGEKNTIFNEHPVPSDQQ